jgi:REP element-mobilizing transposase RayT
MRKKPLVDNEYYHIYNRGVDKREVFSDEKDFSRFLLSMNLLNDKEDGAMIKWRDYKKYVKNANIDDFLKLNFRRREYLVDIVSYCLMSNHYHMVLKQRVEKGIEKFLQKLGTSYTKYFNERNKRNGALFQGRFKSSLIKSEGSLSRFSVYASCNSEVHKVCPAKNYRWCSFPHHIGKSKDDLVRDEEFRSEFRNIGELEKYAAENIADFQARKQDQDIVFE